MYATEHVSEALIENGVAIWLTRYSLEDDEHARCIYDNTGRGSKPMHIAASCPTYTHTILVKSTAVSMPTYRIQTIQSVHQNSRTSLVPAYAPVPAVPSSIYQG
jgi:hypothetical protein